MPRLAAVFSLFTCLITTATHSSAAAFTWDGGGGSSSWGTGANWNPDGASFTTTTCLTFAGSGAQTYPESAPPEERAPCAR